MSDMTPMLVETATRQFSELCTRRLLEDAEQGVWPQTLWDALQTTGLVMAAVSEARGGAGADLGDVLALIKTAGSHSAPVPLAETLLAEQLLAAADLRTIAGPLTIGPVLRLDHLNLVSRSGKWMLSGTLHKIPWAHQARAVVVLADSEQGLATVVVEAPSIAAQDWNYAREPRDTLRFDNYVVPDSAVAPAGRGFTYDEFFFRGALFRAVAMAGALETVLELTVKYAKERVQFGKPIGKFQAVQQQIAVLASQVAAASAAAQAAGDAAMEGNAFFETAAAKARIGEAAGAVAAIAHQVHGAIGFTHEYALHRSTRRLWSWRDEFGTESEWMAWIGRTVARVGGEDLWPFIATPHDFNKFMPAGGNSLREAYAREAAK